MIFYVSIFLKLDYHPSEKILAKGQIILGLCEGETFSTKKEYSIEQEVGEDARGNGWCKLEVKAGNQLVLSYEGDTSAESLSLLSLQEQENFAFFMAQLDYASKFDDDICHYKIDESKLLPSEVQSFVRLCRGNLNA